MSDLSSAIKKVKGEDEDDTTSPAILSPVFTSQYEVVKKIFQYLHLPDLLLNASLVNKQWFEIGKIVRKHRKNKAFTLLLHPYSPHDQLAFEYFNANNSRDPGPPKNISVEAKMLVESGEGGYFKYVKNSKRRAFKTIKKIRHPNNEHFGDEFVKGIREQVGKTVGDSWDEAQCLFSFATEGFDWHLQNEDGEPPRPREIMSLVHDRIQDTIPCITCLACGVVGTSSPHQGSGSEGQRSSFELERQKLPCLSSLGIPKVAGLNIKFFRVSPQQNKWNKKIPVTPNTCRRLLGITVEIERTLQAIVLLHKPQQRSSLTVRSVLEYLKQNPHVALAGGIHADVLIGGVPDEQMEEVDGGKCDSIIAAGLLIFGEKEILKCSTIALVDPAMSENNLMKMEKLKDRCSLVPKGEGGVAKDPNSFAFMFVCNGRGKKMHGKAHAESHLFNKMFPRTPLIGSFTYGEYCHEVLPPKEEDEGVGVVGVDGGEGGEEEEEEVQKTPYKIEYSYTTVFLVVSFKHPKTKKMNN